MCLLATLQIEVEYEVVYKLINYKPLQFQWVDPKTEEPTGKPVLQKDVYDEFNNKISTKYKIDKFRFRFVTKNYAFELDDVPRTCEYLEIRYSVSPLLIN